MSHDYDTIAATLHPRLDESDTDWVMTEIVGPLLDDLGDWTFEYDLAANKNTGWVYCANCSAREWDGE